MGLFSGLFKKKEINEVVNNVDVTEGEVGDAVAPIVVDPNNVMEQMQNNFADEVAREEENAALESEPTAIFNQNIALDSNDPMSIFGVAGEDKKE